MDCSLSKRLAANISNLTTPNNSVSLDQLQGWELGPTKNTYAEQRKEMIKSKIKSRINSLLTMSKAPQQKTAPSWKQQGEFSLDEIIQKHTMRNLKRKYLDYMQKSKEQSARMRIGGAYNSHPTPSPIIHSSHFPLQPNTTPKRLRTPRRAPVPTSPQPHTIRNMFQTCRVSPVKLEKRPLTAGNKLLNTSKASLMSPVTKEKQHYRHSSEVPKGYFFGQLRRKRQSVNVVVAGKTGRVLVGTGEKQKQNQFLEIKPWEFFDDLQRQ